jgi:hypothetical protein
MPEFAHAGVHDRDAGFTALPGTQVVGVILAPGETFKAEIERPVGGVR